MVVVLSPQEFARANLSTALYRPQAPADRTIWRNPATGQDEIFSNGSWQPLQVSGIVPVVNGGTGADTAAGARSALGIGSLGQQSADNANLSGKLKISGQRAISTSVAANATDRTILATGGAGGITFTLPSANEKGRQIVVIKVDATAGAITIERAGTDTFLGGGTSIALAAQGDKCILESDDAGVWYRLS